MSLGKNLQEIMLRKGINANELALAIDVAPSTIYSMIKRNSKKADIEILIRIAKYLEVSADELLGSEEDSYYINPETAKLAQEAFEDPDTRILLSAKRDLSPEAMKAVVDMVKHLKKIENPQDEVFPDEEYPDEFDRDPFDK